MEKENILEIRHVTKRFPGVVALDDVSIKIKRGTVHALVGENGAGKSTLIKILSGIYVVYDGEVGFDGEVVKFSTPSEAKKSGLSVVHQELKLSEPLTVAENIFLGNLRLTPAGLVDWKTMFEKSQAIIDDLGVDIDAHDIVANLTVAKKQIVEICKSITHDCKLLIMDEPSATLTNKELDVLFKIIKKLKEQGVTIIYISHRMEEVFKLADEISVLRDGKHIATIPTESIDTAGLVRLMVGREVNMVYPRSGSIPGEVILEVKDISLGNKVKGVSFDVRKGEVLGIAGLVGSGRTELMQAVLGIAKKTSGTVELYGKKVEHHQFIDAIGNGFGLVPEDRKVLGATLRFSIKNNICMTDIPKIAPGGIVNDRLETDHAQKLFDKLRVAAPSINTLVESLSGGNQQKVVVAKWLYRDSEILVMDEPTRGIDVGAKMEIYELIANLARNGKTLIVISSELPELLGISDRIIVLHEGVKVGEMTHDEATQDKVMSLCV